MDTGEKEEGNSDEALLNEHSFCESAEIFDPLSIKTETRDECDEFDINEMHHDYLNKHIKNEPLSPINNQCQSSYNFNEHFEEETEFSDVVNAIVSPPERRNSFSFNVNLKIKTEFPENNSIEESPENPYSPDSASESEAWNRTFATGKSNDEIFSISRVDVDQDAEHNIVQMVVNDAEEENPSDSGQKFMVTENGLKSQRKTEREILAKLGLDKDISEEQGKEPQEKIAMIKIKKTKKRKPEKVPEDELKCPECSARFHNKKSLSKHIKLHGVNEELEIACSKCNFQFPRLENGRFDFEHKCRNQQNEVVINSVLESDSHRDDFVLRGDDNMFHCTSCPYKSKLIFNFKRHKLSHEKKTDIKPDLMCHFCGHLVKTQAGLKHHLNVVHHMGQYTCLICKKAFDNENSMVKHSNNAHLNIKEWKCETCEKCFTTNRSLKKHRNRVCPKQNQPKDISLTCEICNKDFGCVKYKKEHYKRKHLGVTHCCNGCGVNFKYRSSLKWHRDHSNCKLNPNLETSTGASEVSIGIQ